MTAAESIAGRLLDSGHHTVLEAGYLEEGRLDHGYASTAHKAQGATLDSVFVLGSEDLYREWGYTALSRHREEARFYLVSPGSTERCLAQREPDRLNPQLQAALGASRAKHLALDEVDGRPRGDGGRRLLARGRALEANVARMQLEDARAQAERAAVGDQLGRLGEERTSLRGWQRRQRAELDRRIEGSQAAVEHWCAAVEQASSALDAARHELDAFSERHAVRDTELDPETPTPVAGRGRGRTEQDRVMLTDPPNWLSRTLGPRPAGFAAREAWLEAARDLIQEREVARQADRDGLTHGDAGELQARLAPEVDLGPGM